MNSSSKNIWESGLILASSIVYAAATVFMIFYGKHYVDEGYYHITAYLTSQGQLPYRDYLYVQAPLYPFIYGIAFKLFGSGFVAARAISGFFSVVAFSISIWAAARMGGRRAAAAAAALLACQPFTIYFLTIIKLYSVSALTLAFFMWALTIQENEKLRTAIASLCLVLGTAIRISILPGLAIYWLIVLYRTRKWQILLPAVAASSLLAGAIFASGYWLNPDGFLFGVFTYHTQKEAFGLIRQIIHRLISLSSLCQIYYFHLLIAVAWLAIYRVKPLDDKDTSAKSLRVIIEGGIVMAIIAGFHFTSQAPYSFRYIPMLLPPAAVVLGLMAVSFESFLKRTSGIQLGFMFALACSLVFLARGREEIGPVSPMGAAAQIKYMAAQIEALSPPDRPILTFNNSYAVESNRDVVAGDEMNVLTYDPEWTNEKCSQYKVLNVDMLERMIDDRTFGLILLTEYSFLGNFPVFFNPGELGARPRIMAAVEKNYMKVKDYAGAGYMGEDVRLFLPRDSGRINRIDTEALNGGNR